MLPSRGLTRNPASALRYSISSRIKPTRTSSARQFSQAQSQSQSQSSSSLLSARRSVSRSCASHYASITPSFSSVGYGAGIASGVFAQRSGAARNLSLWPFGSKSPSPQTTEIPSEQLPEAATATQPPVPETPTLSSSTPPVESTTDTTDLSQFPEDLLRELDSITSPSADITAHIGYLKELGLEYGFPYVTLTCQWVVEHIHVYSGMPWWGTIACVAILFRAAMFYPTLIGAKHQARMQKVQNSPAFIKAKNDMNEAALRTKDQHAMLYARQEMRRLMKTSGASFVKPFVGFAMFPFSIGMFRLIRAMADIPVPGLDNGGLAWFTDLTVHDPFFILPAISVGLGYLTISQIQRTNPAQSDPTQLAVQKGMKNFLPPLMFLGTAWLPAGLQWFFLWVSVGSVAQTQATLSPRVRRWAGIPPLPTAKTFTIPNNAINYQKPTAHGIDSIRTTFRESVSAAGKTFKDATGATDEKARWKKAQDYESKRAEEEKERSRRRMEEVRRRRAERRP
ncbi:hypothetical protein F5Y03DRAFT_338764 [Xylaria venustula]|nr:hypothetical protein F5Y03DRAFT_338764 [Xylaria venustula]